VSTGNIKLLKRAVVVGSLFVALSPLACLADLYYSGSLTGDKGGITATDGWDNPGTKITWIVTQNQDLTWNYHYEFTVPTGSKALSHIIFEVSEKFDDLDYTYNGGLTADLDWYGPGDPSNPGIQDRIHGIKFEGFSDGMYTWVIEFDSTHVPVWGDFYAKDGKEATTDGKIQVYAYNTGFTANDVDEATNHILVPDTVSYVPIPGALLLGTLGLGVAGLRLRRTV